MITPVLEPKILKKGLFPRRTFSAGNGRPAYDLERVLHLPPPSETLYDLRRDTAQVLVKGIGEYLKLRPFQIFYNGIVSSDREKIIGDTPSMYGWTHFKRHASLSYIQLSEDGNGIVMKLEDTGENEEERHISFDSLPKIAFLNEVPRNDVWNKNRAAGIYLSESLHYPSNRSEWVYLPK